MVSVLKVGLVKYECSCHTWLPLCQLYFCRKCDKLKCPMCLNEDIDIVFCPNCMESGDNQHRKFLCNNCNQCPMCENVLVVRGLGNGTFYIQCGSCHWMSQDSGIPYQPSQSNWPEHTNPMAEKLGEIMQWMKEVSDNEKIEREKIERGRKLQATKRLSNLGVLTNDRFGLNTAYAMRKKALNTNNKATRSEGFIEATSDVPELDPSIFTTPVDVGKVPTLAQIIRQPLCGADKQLYPAKVKLISRRFLRCVESDSGLLYRGELNSSAVKPKMSCFSFEIVPEIRLSRPVDLIVGQMFSFFLIVSNNSPTSMKVNLRGVRVENDPDCIDCSDFKVEIPVPNRDNVADIDDYLQNSAKLTEPENEQVVMIKRHRFGLRVDCKATERSSSKSHARFCLSYSYPDETPNKWIDLNVKVFLDESGMAAT